MDAQPSPSPQVLDEDLQIVRATLASISDDVNRLSPHAGQAVSDALIKIDEAHAEFVRSEKAHEDPPKMKP
jgi:hypothetical protein